MDRTETIPVIEAATKLGVSTDWIAKACRLGVLPHVPVGNGQKRFRRIPLRAGVEEYIRSRSKAYERQINDAAYARTRRSAERNRQAVPQVY
jgi:hypothetical protein